MIKSGRTKKMSSELLYNAVVTNWLPGKIDLKKIQLDEQNKYQEETKSGFIYLY